MKKTVQACPIKSFTVFFCKFQNQTKQLILSRIKLSILFQNQTKQLILTCAISCCFHRTYVSHITDVTTALLNQTSTIELEVDEF